jgi:hypothetical protein
MLVACNKALLSPRFCGKQRKFGDLLYNSPKIKLVEFKMAGIFTQINLNSWKFGKLSGLCLGLFV